MPELINWDLVKNPLNWVIIVLMCLFWLVLLALVFPQQTTSEN